jgi:CHAT domain-containing protein
LARKGAQAVAQAEPVTLADVQAELPDSTVLVAYFCTGLRGPEAALLQAIPPQSGMYGCLAPVAKLIGFAITPTSCQVAACEIDPNAFQPSASQYDGQRFLRPAISQRIYNDLIAPFAALLQDMHVVIAPHGPLHQLPFAALCEPSGQFLLERIATIGYTPSATVFVHALQQPASAAGSLCLAYGYAGVAGRLRHTEEEAQLIMQLTAGDSYQPGTSGSSVFFHTAKHYRWIHLACHAECNLAEPLESFLELAADVRLTAAEVLQAEHLDAEVVVLSACRTGVSKVLRGDEPIGLVRAFLSIGARTVLVTLWEVEDHSALLLMEWFYRGLIGGQSAATALHAAQQQLRAMPGYRDPYYWAGYVLLSG